MTLLDWRRRVAAIYADVRATAAADPAGALTTYRAARDELFRTHPDSPLPAGDRAAFPGLAYWDHDPALRFEAVVEPAERLPTSATSLSGRIVRPRADRSGPPPRSATSRSTGSRSTAAASSSRSATATSGTETYGAGRYLLDTIKGADLGGTGDRLILDFNYAYHPSCVYDPRWVCPLAPRENWLTVPVRAGERLREP